MPSLEPTAFSITAIIGRPTAHDVDTLQQELDEIVSSISLPTDPNYNHGLFGMINTEKRFRAHCHETKAFSPPKSPGPMSADPTVYHVWKANSDAHEIYKSAALSAKKAIIGAVEPDYIALLKDPSKGFSEKTALDLLQHLRNTYGKYDNASREANFEKLTAPWDINRDSYENLHARVRNCVHFAKQAKDPISPRVVITELLKLFRPHPALADAIETFEREDSATNFTPAEFHEHFKKHIQYHQKQLPKFPAAKHAATAGNIGYANVATDGTDDLNVPGSGWTWGYCWSHGLQVTHNSRTCTRKKDGHKDEATLVNMMHGNNNIQRVGSDKRRRPAPAPTDTQE